MMALIEGHEGAMNLITRYSSSLLVAHYDAVGFC
jgi:hypothetical protein